MRRIIDEADCVRKAIAGSGCIRQTFADPIGQPLRHGYLGIGQNDAEASGAKAKERVLFPQLSKDDLGRVS
jgi:hypothetical protein